MPFQSRALARDFWVQFLKVFALVASTFLGLLVTTIPSVVLSVTSLWLTYVHIYWDYSSARFDRPPAWLGQSGSESLLKQAWVGGETSPPRRGPCHPPCKARAGGRLDGAGGEGRDSSPRGGGHPRRHGAVPRAWAPLRAGAAGSRAAGLGGSPGQEPGGSGSGTGLRGEGRESPALRGRAGGRAHVSCAAAGRLERGAMPLSRAAYPASPPRAGPARAGVPVAAGLLRCSALTREGSLRGWLSVYKSR